MLRAVEMWCWQLVSLCGKLLDLGHQKLPTKDRPGCAWCWLLLFLVWVRGCGKLGAAHHGYRGKCSTPESFQLRGALGMRPQPKG